MAGLPWFELDVDMPDDPKVNGLAERLRQPLAGWYVVRLYAYCYRFARDAYEGPGASATIEKACGWKGKTGVLLSALESEGFIDREGERLVVHGVSERLAPHLAKRTRDAERMAERRANVARTSPRHSSDVAGDKDKDKDRDTSEITNVSDPPPFSAPLRAARLGVGHPAFEAVEHWTKSAWPATSTVQCPVVTTSQAQSLAALCGKHTTPVVLAAMDRAAADPFWSDKLDLDTFIAKFGRFLHDKDPPAAKSKVTAEASDHSKFGKGEVAL